MCIGAPKMPAAPPPIPVRQPVILPDNGDPSVVAGLKNQRRLTTSAMILTGRGGTLGSPGIAAPLGNTGS
jgi:hypothetical protein